MGTSNSNRGAGSHTPLVPTWLNQGGVPPVLPPDPDNNPPDLPEVPLPPLNRPIIRNGEEDRYRAARSNFTKFVKSGGDNRHSMGKALSNYVAKTSGGSRNASLRMGSSRATTGILLSFLSSVQTQGATVTLRALNFQNLIGRSLSEVFIELVDYFCPDGGNIDEGIARSAFIETIAQLAENGIENFDTLNPEQMQIIIETFTTNAIEQRLCNDIGTKICIASESINSFEHVHDILHEFILGSVSDALNNLDINIATITVENANATVDRIYQSAYTILEQLAENE